MTLATAPQFTYVKGFAILALVALLAGLAFGKKVAYAIVAIYIALILLSGAPRVAQLLGGSTSQ